jgi:hypothetical protein
MIELEQLRALLKRTIEPLEWYAEYLNTAPVWHCTGFEANTVNSLLDELRAATKYNPVK